MSPPGPSVGVIFSRLGPYHVARLAAAAPVLASRGLSLRAIEVARTDRLYAWNIESGPAPFERSVLFPDRDYQDLDARAIARATRSFLDQSDLACVALPGWSFPEARAGLEWCRSNGRGAIVMSESCRYDFPRTFWKEWWKRRRVSRFAAGLVGGQDHADYLVELGIPRKRIFFGYDAVDNDYFAAGADRARAAAKDLRAKYRLPEQYFLSNCRFVEKKNLPWLLSAYAEYRRRAGGAAWSLVLSGDGPEKRRIIAEISRLGLEESVCLPGFVQYPDLPVVYGLAQAFILASRVEQWGLVVNEAMAAGLPVLVSNRCGCARDLVEPGRNGAIFDPAEPAALVDEMIALSTDASRLAEMANASRRIVQRFSPAAFADGLARATEVAIGTVHAGSV